MRLKFINNVIIIFIIILFSSDFTGCDLSSYIYEYDGCYTKEGVITSCFSDFELDIKVLNNVKSLYKVDENSIVINATLKNFDKDGKAILLSGYMNIYEGKVESIFLKSIDYDDVKIDIEFHFNLQTLKGVISIDDDPDDNPEEKHIQAKIIYPSLEELPIAQFYQLKIIE